jgi:hypothetical protein
MKANTRLVNWLTKLGHTNAKPVLLKIENEEFIGCSYTLTGEYTASMDAVSRGDKKAGEKYYENRYYFLGNLPFCYSKKSNVCFLFENKTFFISGYGQDNLDDTYHPFGKSFMLGEWNTEKFGEIDMGERHPYKRIPMSMTDTN